MRVLRGHAYYMHIRYIALLSVLILFGLPASSFASEHKEVGRPSPEKHDSHGSDTKDSHSDRDHEKDHPDNRDCRPETTLSQDLVSYWKLDGSSVDPVSGNNGADTAVTYGKAFGKIGSGASFDGAASAISLGAPANLSLTGDMSIAMWVYPLDMAEAGSVFAKTVGIGDSDNTYDLAVFDNAPMQMVYANGSYYFIDSAISLPSHKWSFIAFTRGAGNASPKFYINGADAGLSNNNWAAITPLTGGDVYIGRRGDGNFFHGYIDEVGIWSRVLSAGEISQLYNHGLGKTYPF